MGILHKLETVMFLVNFDAFVAEIRDEEEREDPASSVVHDQSFTGHAFQCVCDDVVGLCQGL